MYRYFRNVSFIQGRCPGSKAAHFSQQGSFATVPNKNISDCDFTLGCWIRRTINPAHDQYVITVWSMSGKPLILGVKYLHGNSFYLVYFLRQSSEYEWMMRSYLINNGVNLDEWTHIAVTCSGANGKITMFVNGTERNSYTSYQMPGYNFSNTPPGSPYHIGNNPFNAAQLRYQFYGSVMNLYLTGVALSTDEVFKAFMKGEILLGMLHLAEFPEE